MIAFIQGNLIHKTSDSIVVDVQGVGYELSVPAMVSLKYNKLPVAVKLWVFTKVREDSFKLYGFSTPHQREVFKILLNVNKVGPKIALAAISTLNLNVMRYAIEHDKHEVFASVPGIGSTLAQKITVDLKNKMKIWPSETDVKEEGLVSSIQLDLDHFGFTDEMPESPLEPVESLKLDISSALENLGYRKKEITTAIKKLDFDQQDPDFSVLFKQALGQFRKKNIESRGHDPREVF